MTAPVGFSGRPLASKLGSGVDANVVRADGLVDAAWSGLKSVWRGADR